MLSASPSPADRGRQETWLAVIPHDRGPLGSVLSSHSEVPCSFFQKCVFPSHLMYTFPAIPSPLPLLCADFLPLLCHLFIGSFAPPSHPLSPSMGLCYGPLLLKHHATQGTSGCSP
uniref:Uncharacterized protein n=1 Tax=Mus musculus TaxID=10090 RepID=Q9D6E0_MOUSE|nr:unnamed protein product [Mus musculus]